VSYNRETVSTLTLIRHGQAEPFQWENSRLTETGEAQAAKLAEYWLRHGVTFDEVQTGPLPRQVRTEQVIAEKYRAAGCDWPAAQRDDSWREYDAHGVLQHLAPADPRVSALTAEFERARGGPDENRRFQHMFEAAMMCWIESPAPSNGVESWTAFRERVTGAIQRVMDGPASRRVAIFTSGGPIGLAVQTALAAPPKSFLDLNYRVRNGSLTEFVFDRARLTLDYFNSVSHLEDATLRTYR
jgi:broad specificity phosphatase PhoE